MSAPVAPNGPRASDQPIRIASCESPGIEWATMPTTTSRVGVSPVAKLSVSPSRMSASLGQRLRHDDRPAGIEGGEGRGRISTALDEDQASVRGEVLAGDGGRLLAHASEGHSEEPDRRN